MAEDKKSNSSDKSPSQQQPSHPQQPNNQASSSSTSSSSSAPRQLPQAIPQPPMQSKSVVYTDTFPPLEGLERFGVSRTSAGTERGGPLDVCIHVAIAFAKQGKTEDEKFQKFVHSILPYVMDKLAGAKTSSTFWTPHILMEVKFFYIYVLDLIGELIPLDDYVLLGLLEKVLDHGSPYGLLMDRYSPNKSRSTSVEQYAVQLSESRPFGILVDLINHFGDRGCFAKMVERCQRKDVNSTVLALFLKPFSSVYELLTLSCLEKYFEPVRVCAVDYLSHLGGEALKAECNMFHRTDAIATIFKTLKSMRCRLIGAYKTGLELDVPHLDLILKLLKSSSYNGVMYALKELNRVITASYHGKKNEEWLTDDMLAKWLLDHNIIHLVFQNNLHQAQYVAKLEDIVQLLVSKRLLANEHLTEMWDAQVGKHEAIVTNIHDLFAKLAFRFDGVHLDHLFTCFQRSWGGTPSNMERLLGFVRRLAEEDTAGTMAVKVLDVMWSLAHDASTPREIVELCIQSLARLAEVPSLAKHRVKQTFLERCVSALQKGEWVVPAMSLMQLIHESDVALYDHRFSESERGGLCPLVARNGLVSVVVASLSVYATRARTLPPQEDPNALVVEGRCSHFETIHKYFHFLQLLLRDADGLLMASDVRVLWELLVEQAAYEFEKTTTLNFIADNSHSIVEGDVELLTTRVLKFNAETLGDAEFRCFYSLFRHVNNKLKKVTYHEQDMFVHDLDLVGLKFLWTFALQNESQFFASHAIHLLIQIHTSLDPSLQERIAELQDQFMQQCMQHLSEALFHMNRDGALSEKEKTLDSRVIERSLRLLDQYIRLADDSFYGRRSKLPLGFSSRGEDMPIKIMAGATSIPFQSHERELVTNVRQFLASRFPEFPPAQIVMKIEDCEVPLTADNGLLVRWVSTYPVVISASSNKTSVALQHGPEDLLPGIMFSVRSDYMEKLMSLACLYDNNTVLVTARAVLDLLPANPAVLEPFLLAFGDPSKTVSGSLLSYNPSPEGLYATHYRLTALASLLFPNFFSPSYDVNQLRLSFDELGGANLLLAIIADHVGLLATTAGHSMVVTDIYHVLRTSLHLLSALVKEKLVLSSDPNAPRRPIAFNEAQIINALVGLLLTLATRESNLNYNHLNTPIVVNGIQLLQDVLALHPKLVEILFAHPEFPRVLEATLLMSPHESIRLKAKNGFIVLCATESLRPALWAAALDMHTRVSRYPASCAEFFDYVCHLAPIALQDGILNLDQASILLTEEIACIQSLMSASSDSQDLLAGRLRVSAVLLRAIPARREEIGLALMDRLFYDFLFPHSKLLVSVRSNPIDTEIVTVSPICSSVIARKACFQFVVELCTGSITNLNHVVNLLTVLHYDERDFVAEFNFLPPPLKGQTHAFVGLKNAGATCYMNSVLQQLYMQPEIQSDLLSITDEQHHEGEALKPVEAKEGKKEGEDAAEGVAPSLLFQLQSLFVHLRHSEAQFHAPEGFWKTYKIGGAPVNVREQQDAMEFFNFLGEQLEDPLKKMKRPSIIADVSSGLYSVQKIIKSGCEHRYEKEQGFQSLEVNVQNHHTLAESMEQFVKGDLLDGANQYLCEGCNAKRDAIFRTCIKKAPRLLVFNLKRFDFDWEKEEQVKLNNLFEFPETIDMSPYTVEGLEAREGSGEPVPPQNYVLVGVLVHSGQAYGGHYYSYIRHRHATGAPTSPTWYKFDDGEVTECAIDSAEKMKYEWFGGEFEQEVWDTALRRNVMKKRDRWWNAYMLFYERVEETPPQGDVSKVPSGSYPTLLRQVSESNLIVHHQHSIFSPDYFNFMYELCATAKSFGGPSTDPTLVQDHAMQVMECAVRFLTTYCFKADKKVRQPLPDWGTLLGDLCRDHPLVRAAFMNKLLQETQWTDWFLLWCPANEIRSRFAAIVTRTLQETLNQEQPDDALAILADYISKTLIPMASTLSDHYKYTAQYFKVLLDLAHMGPLFRSTLNSFDFPLIALRFLLFEADANRFQSPDHELAHSFISVMVRSSTLCLHAAPSTQHPGPRRNPLSEDTRLYDSSRYPANLVSTPLALSPEIVDVVAGNFEYWAKTWKAGYRNEQYTKLLKYICWEHSHNSSTLLIKLLERVHACSNQSNDVLVYLSLLGSILTLQDGLMGPRFKFILEHQFGLISTMRDTQRTPRRSYFILRFLMNQSSVPQFKSLLLEMRQHWAWAIQWLYTQINPNHFGEFEVGVSSNEKSNSHWVERTSSAMSVFTMANSLVPNSFQVLESDPSDDEGESPGTFSADEEGYVGHGHHSSST